MPKRTDIKKILIIGSGPIVIGDARKAHRAEGYDLFGELAGTIKEHAR
jgi:hypothetical protein